MSIQAFETLFPNPQPIIGVLQYPAFPASVTRPFSQEELLARLEQETLAYVSTHVDALLLDMPVSALAISQVMLSLMCQRIRILAPGLPIGLCVRPNQVELPLALCSVGLADFIRIPVLMGVEIQASGLLESAYDELLSASQTTGVGQLAPIVCDLSLQTLLSPAELSRNLDITQRLSYQLNSLKGIQAVSALALRQEDSLSPELHEFIEAQSPWPIWLEASQESSLKKSTSGYLLNHSVRRQSNLESAFLPSVDPGKVQDFFNAIRSLA